MIYLHWISGILLALIWLSRVLDAGFGVRRIPDISRPEWDRKPKTDQRPARVAIIVPARNEATSIQQALTRLTALDYPNIEVIAVNDRSTDQTGEFMDQVASEASGKVKVIHISELPPGWLGKAHAMWTAATHTDADWLLFTDADVMFQPESVRRALAYAETEPADHVVLLPEIVMKRVGEKMMISFFQLLFVFGHRPWKVADPKTKDHMGVGAFNLVRRTVYEAVGTYRALRFDVLDDMKLGKIIKDAGFRQRVVFGDGLIQIRWARGARGVVDNLTKNFFAVMRYQAWLALLGCLVLGILNLAPFAGVVLAHAWARVPYAVALLSMFALYSGIWRQAEIHPWYFFVHPISTVLVIYTMLRSTFLTLWQGGVKWRGTFYALDELKKGLV